MAGESKGKRIGASPRPVVALINLTPAEKTSLKKYFPTVYVVDDIMDLTSVGAASEVDLIVSSSARSPEDYNAVAAYNDCPYRNCHLILLGKAAWEPYFVPAIVGTGVYECSASSYSRQYTISDDIDARLKVIAEEVLPRSALGAPVISHIQRIRKDAGDDRASWIAWAQEPSRPLAVVGYREHCNKGLAWFPTRPKDSTALVKVICALWATRDREAFPGFVDWHDSKDWMTAEEISIHYETVTLANKIEETRAKYAAVQSEIYERLALAKERADTGPRALLNAQNEILVAAVKSIFEDLGFDVRDVDAGRLPTLPKREDLQLRHQNNPSWVALIEVKGHKKRGANAEDLIKIGTHVRTFLKEEGKEPTIKVYVCNSQFDLPPDERPRPYAGSTAGETFCHDDPAVPGFVIPTTDLFRLHRDRNRIGLEEARRLLFAQPGVFSYSGQNDD